MKKYFSFILSIFILAVNICDAFADEMDWTGSEASGEEVRDIDYIDYYDWADSQYDYFLEHPDEEAQFRPEDMWQYGVPLIREMLTNGMLEQEFLYSAHADIEIYDKKIVFLTDELNFYFDIGNFVWYATNQGIKIVEYKSIDRLRDSFKGEEWRSTQGKVFEGFNFDFFYYDSIEEYVEKYKKKSYDVYINGEKQEMQYCEVRNELPILSIRSFFEAVGIRVDWIAQHAQIHLSKNGRTIYCFLEEARDNPMYRGINDWGKLLLMQEVEYRSYIAELETGVPYAYDFFYPITDVVGCECTVLLREDRIVQGIGGIGILAEMFGVYIDTSDIPIKDGNIYVTASEGKMPPLYEITDKPGEWRYRD